jgi:hypothetical protein
VTHLNEKFFKEGSEVLTTVVIKSTIFWDITPCSPFKVNQRLGGTYRLHLQGRRRSRARNQRESRWQAERRLTFNRLHGVISQKIVLSFKNIVLLLKFKQSSEEFKTWPLSPKILLYMLGEAKACPEV